MLNDNKYKEEEALLDEVLKSEPACFLPDNFAEVVAEKAGRKFAWEQYIKEFLIYLGAFAGIAVLSAATAFIWLEANWQEWFQLVVTNAGTVAGISILTVFILFSDRVLLRYFMFRAKVEVR